MRRALFVMSAVLVASPAAAADHAPCAEVSGVLGDCEYREGPDHNCLAFVSSQARIVVCLPTVGYANTAR